MNEWSFWMDWDAVNLSDKIPAIDFQNIAVIPWYQSDQSYEQFRATAVDPDCFFATFSEWRIAALEHESRTLANGFEMIRSRVNYADFDIWARKHDVRNEQNSRSVFAYCRLQSLFDRQSVG